MAQPGPLLSTQREGVPYATHFPIVSIFDMVRAQFRLLDHLGVDRLYASIGSSMGAMQSLAAGWLHPERVGKVVSISGTARSIPSSIAMRYAQRSVLMADPNWNNGFYYDAMPPHTGMKLARPLCPDFLIETYLDHQGEEFCLKYDANSLIYISKAMDLFDMTRPALEGLRLPEAAALSKPESESASALPRPHATSHSKSHPPPTNPAPTSLCACTSDILFTIEQQREVVDALRMAGNDRVVYYELGGVWGHDTFLLDVLNVGGAIRGVPFMSRYAILM
ncbi:Homoserine o-acetyltransferase [Mycena sanguinolenta]|uniref:Homoserine o-acetyltransferase n=1 Tax=Mycena sanguinolenta TaxID=230812 RepID=A0A8H7DIT4_9AGAR|nr:Homoserine o-acetyltransferase [Mycena sanguinolenta]